MEVNSSLCNLCQSVISTIEPEVWGKHHANAKCLSLSAESGCPLCALLWNSFSSSEMWFSELAPPSTCPKNSYKFPSVDFKLTYHKEIDLMQYHFQLTFPDPPKREWSPPEKDWKEDTSLLEEDTSSFGEDTSLLEEDTSRHPISNNIVVIPVSKDLGPRTAFKCPENTDSVSSWTTAKTWLRSCVESHFKCSLNIDNNWSPTRLIDIGICTQSDLRLHITNRASPISSYATLSHCWGKLKTKQLLLSNLSTLVSRIAFTELSRTFQDAIVITRRLGLRFLWIDSLCIIQDSIEDWARESAMMGLVYSNATCNIAATAAEDGRTGCFYEKNPLLAQPCRVKIDSFPSPVSGSGKYDLVPQAFFSQCISDLPLNNRAWVMQEQFLARRIIHCGRNQLFWECQEMAACEMYPTGVPNPALYEGYTFDFKWIDMANAPQDSSFTRILRSQNKEYTMAQLEALQTWDRIVHSYMKRSLTFEQDRLIAISGVARKLQPSIQSDYLAGLWKTDLPLQLLWEIYSLSGAAHVPKRTAAYCAPSWSWASVTADILLFTLETDVLPRGKAYMIQILESTIFLKTDDTMGQVSGGSLTLRGWLRSFEFDRENLRFRHRGNIVAMIEIDDMHIQERVKWFCLPIIALKSFLDPFLDVIGLVLERSGPVGQYRRVGLFKTSGLSEDNFKLFERPVYQWEASTMKVTFTPNVTREYSFPDHASVPDLDDSGDEEDEWIESVIIIV